MVNINTLADLEFWIKYFKAVIIYKPTSAKFDLSYRVSSVVYVAVHFSSGVHFGNSVSILLPEIDSFYDA